MVISVNPSMSDLYRAIMGFEMLPAKTVSKYDFVNGAPAIGEYLTIANSQAWYLEKFGGASKPKNFHDYMKPDAIENIQFPERFYNRGFDSILTAQVMIDFFGKKQDFRGALKGPKTKNPLILCRQPDL